MTRGKKIKEILKEIKKFEDFSDDYRRKRTSQYISHRPLQKFCTNSAREYYQGDKTNKKSQRKLIKDKKFQRCNTGSSEMFEGVVDSIGENFSKKRGKSALKRFENDVLVKRPKSKACKDKKDVRKLEAFIEAYNSAKITENIPSRYSLTKRQACGWWIKHGGKSTIAVPQQQIESVDELVGELVVCDINNLRDMTKNQTEIKSNDELIDFLEYYSSDSESALVRGELQSVDYNDPMSVDFYGESFIYQTDRNHILKLDYPPVQWYKDFANSKKIRKKNMSASDKKKWLDFQIKRIADAYCVSKTGCEEHVVKLFAFGTFKFSGGGRKGVFVLMEELETVFENVDPNNEQNLSLGQKYTLIDDNFGKSDMNKLVDCIHERGYIHMDVHGGNIMRDSGGNYKLIDINSVMQMAEMTNPDFKFLIKSSYPDFGNWIKEGAQNVLMGERFEDAENGRVRGLIKEYNLS